MSKRRIAVYCRVSTDLEQQEDSLKLQQEWFKRRYEMEPEVEVVGIYADDKSGTSIALRPAFCKMLQDCRSGKIDQIVTKSVSRFSRNMADFLQVIRELHGLKIGVVFEKEGFNTMDDHGEMIISVLAAIAQEEVNTISTNLTWAIRKRDASGRPNYRVSYGYRRDQKTGTWHIQPREAERVCAVFQMAATGHTYSEMEKKMQEMEAREPTGANWTRHRLHYVLTNVHYIGDVLTQKTYVPDYLNHKRRHNLGMVDQYYLKEHHDAIIERELFRRVQAYIDTGKLRSKRRGM